MSLRMVNFIKCYKRLHQMSEAPNAPDLEFQSLQFFDNLVFCHINSESFLYIKLECLQDLMSMNVGPTVLPDQQ